MLALYSNEETSKLVCSKPPSPRYDLLGIIPPYTGAFNIKRWIYYICYKGNSLQKYILQKNFNDSNTNDLFTVADSNSFLSPYEILPIAQENL